jgi:hypothetical protein
MEEHLVAVLQSLEWLYKGVDNFVLDLLDNQAELRSNPADLKVPHRINSVVITCTFFLLLCASGNKHNAIQNPILGVLIT